MHSFSVNPPSPIAPLPPECLELILDCLRNDLASLRQLLLVSRQLFQLTVPVLYRSPFRLAAGVPDPPPLSSVSHSDTYLHSQPHTYDSTTGWAKFLDRTKLLSRLLIQNLQIKPLGKVPRLAVHKTSLLDDSSGMESLEPLLPATEQLNWPKRSPSVRAPSGWSQSGSTLAMNHHDSNDSLNDSAGPSVAGRELAQDSFGHCPDLIRFDDEWGTESDGWSTSRRRMPGQQGTVDEDDKEVRIKSQADTTTRTPATTTTTGTGLLMDYFHFYSHIDHRSIASVIRHIYPGAGRRECDRFMAEIERAVLMHNPRQIVSIHVQCPSVVIPHLLSNMEQFEQISAIELLDAVWTIHELEMVYQFLSEHAAMFPAGDFETEEKDVSGHDGVVVLRPLALRQGIRRRTAAIRHFKYATIRNHWDDTTLGGQQFDPLQLIKALGPGLEVIESVYWPRTTLQELDSFDVSALHTLRIGFLDTPREGTAFSQPAFLKRCRQLRTLAGFSSERDMFSWAAEEWNASRRQKKKQDEVSTWRRRTSRRRSLTTLSTFTAEPAPPQVRPLVELQHLRVHGPTDQVVFDILRDAFYGFRNSLRVLEARSDLEHLEGEAEWMDKSMDLLSGRPLSSYSQRTQTSAGNKSRKQRTKKTEASSAEGEEQEVDEQDDEEDEDEDDEDDDDDEEEEDEGEVEDKAFYDRLSSISSGSLLIQWRLPQLTVLQLTGPIAAVFDLDSLLQMPNLHTVSFSILIAPSPWVRRTQSSLTATATMSTNTHSGQQQGASVVGRSNMSQLPLLTGPALRRVMIKGPWHEITDKSLQQMIETIVRVQEPRKNGSSHSSSPQEERRWGDQLTELSVLDNTRVTVPGMVQLARQMDGLQVMGMSLNLPAVPLASLPAHHHHHHQMREFESSANRRRAQDDSEMIARKMIMKARLELPWVDLGPDASHLARRVRRDGYLSRGWDV